ncbi:MAG: GNAT family N-acetyltransferase [Thermoplasmatales archaeon]|nr:GNAT family N-acetyltransferase [Thermoplasmatales archaeon]
MAEITVRPMKEKDISQAADIHRKVVREGLGQGTDYTGKDLFVSFIKKSPKTCLVAEKDGKVAGFVIGFIKDWGFGVERSGWIEMIEVDPKFMGAGIGKKLGEALIKNFKNEKISEVYTSIKWDSGDLVAFFKSIGFDKSSFINLKYKTD